MNPLPHSNRFRGHVGRVLVAMLLACGPEAPTEDAAAKPEIESLQAELRAALLRHDAVAAETAAHGLGSSMAPVLSELRTHEDPEIRSSVLDIAGIAPTAESCRLMLSMLEDAVAEVRERAAAQVLLCVQTELAPDLLAVLERGTPPEAQVSIARQLGNIADAQAVPRLVALRQRATDPQLDQTLSLLLAKLGDASARSELVARLENETPAVRLDAVRDAVYVGDPSLVAEFGPALGDETDVDGIRVCDVAANSAAKLGAPIGYPDALVRLEPAELDAARRHVQSLSGSKS